MGSVWLGWGVGAASLTVMAAAALSGCRATGSGEVGVSIQRDVPGLGPVTLDFRGGWEAALANEEVCGCLVFLGPDGHPLAGVAPGRIVGGRGGGPIPPGATGWTAFLTDQDCDSLDCDALDCDGSFSSRSLPAALEWLEAPAGGSSPFTMLGLRWLGEDHLVQAGELGTWTRPRFQEFSATVVTADRGLAVALLELYLDAGRAAGLSVDQQGLLGDAVTVHEAIRLDVVGSPSLPLGFRGEVLRSGSTVGLQLRVNGGAVAQGPSAPSVGCVGLEALPFQIGLGLVDFDATLARALANDLVLQSKRPGEPMSRTRLKLTYRPTDA